MSFAVANKLFTVLDEQEVEKQENEEEGYSYYKTAFSIYAVIDGEEYSFKGRYDIGSEGKSLLEHIRNIMITVYLQTVCTDNTGNRMVCWMKR